MIDPTDLYDPEHIDGEDPKPIKPAPKQAFTDVVEPTNVPGSFAASSNVNINDYKAFMPEGVYDNKNLDYLRGARQSVGSQLAIRAGQLVPNIVASVSEMIGYGGALLFEWGDNRNYENVFTQAGAAIREKTKEVIGETYRHDNSTFALGDSAWWIDNIANLVEIAIPFAGEARLVSAGMGAVAKAATNAFNLSAKTGRVLSGAAQLGTAGFTAYTEAAMGGATVFDSVYQKQRQKFLASGMDPDKADEQAKHIAAQSAATTVQLSTAMTTLLNLSSVAPFFKKSDDVVQDVLRNQMAKRPGESFAQMATRISGLKADEFKAVMGGHGAAKFLKEMGQEGFEEVVQQFAEVTGEEEGKKGKTHGFLAQLGQFENFFDRTMNEQGALSFVLGAAGGGLQTALIENIKSKRTNIDESGNEMGQATNADGTLKWDEKTGKPVMKTQLVSPRTYDAWSTRKAFNNARDLVAEDITNFAKMQDVYLAAVKKGDPIAIDKARNDMFNVAQMNAVTSGVVEPWVNTFEEIGSLDNESPINPEEADSPTMAMQKGYAVDRKDNEYKSKAKEAAADLKKYQEEYEKLKTRYGTNYEANAGVKDVVDMMFRRKVDLMTNDKLIKHHEEELAKLEEEEKALVSAGDPEAYNTAVGAQNRAIRSAQEVYKQLKIDRDILATAISTKKYKPLSGLIRKYRAVGANDTDLQGAVDDLVKKIDRHIELQSKKIDAANDELLQSSGYNDWLAANPNGTFEEYNKIIQRKYDVNSTITPYRANIEEFKVQHQIAAENYADTLKEDNISRFVKKANDWRTKVIKEAEDLRKKTAEIISNKAKDKTSAARLARIEANKLAERYKGLLKEAVDLLKEKTEELKKVKEEMDALSYARDPIRKISLKKQEVSLEKAIKSLQDKIRLYQSIVAETGIDTASEEENEEKEKEHDDDLEKEEDPPAGFDEEEEAVPDTTLPVDETEEEENPLAEFGYVPPEQLTRYEEFQKEIAVLPIEVIEALDEIEQGWKDGTLQKSLDYLNPLVQRKKIGRGKAAYLLQELWDIVQEDKAAVEDTEDFEAENEDTEVPTVDIADPGEPIDPVINNSEEDEDLLLPETNLTHAGAKTEDAITIARSTLIYEEDFIPADKAFVKFGKPQLDPKSNQDILMPDKLGSNTLLTLVPDTEFDGDINYDDELKQEDTGERSQRNDKFSNYIDVNGKIISYENVPIKIVDENGKTVGYIRRVDWVNAKYPGTNNYRNMVDTLYNEDGTTIDNIELQTELLSALRKQVVDQWNANKQPVEARVVSKGMGMPILNRIEQATFGKEPKVQAKLASVLIPDTSVQIAIIKKRIAHTGKDFPFPGQKGFETLDYGDGMVGMLLPGANGQHFFAPLKGETLSNRPTNIQTAARAIELYLLNDGNKDIEAEIENLRVLTGHDISTEVGLRNFFSQYLTYTQSFLDSELAANAPTKGKERKEQFKFSITDQARNSTKAEIKLGWTYSGRGVVKAAIVNGKLDPNFITALEEGFGTRSKAVQYTDTDRNIRGVNSTGKFKEVFYTKSGWRSKEHDSYNEYVKSWSKTVINGTLRLDNGQYVYTANPQMPFEVVHKPKPRAVTVIQNTNPTEPILKPDMTLPIKGSEAAKEEEVGDLQAKKADIERQEELKENDFVKKIQRIGATYAGNKQFVNIKQTGKEFIEQINYEMYGEKVKPEHLLYFKDKFGGGLYELVNRGYKELTGKTFEEYDAELAALKETQSLSTISKEDTNISEENIDEDKANNFLGLFNMSPVFEGTKTVQEIGTAPSAAKPLTISNLDTVLQSTAEQNRNGLTPQEVYDDLVKRGHSFIPEGYNPFSLCK